MKINKKFTKSSPINLKVMRIPGFHNYISRDIKNIIKIINNKNGWKIANTCPVCRSKNLRNWIKKYNCRLKICNNCSHGFSIDIPKNFSDIYESDFQKKVYVDWYDKERKYRIDKFAKERVKLLQSFKNTKSKLLDFGCGSGWFVEYARKFYDCEGYEPTTQLAEHVKKKLKTTIYTSTKDLPKNYFDIITMFDVLEHAENVSLTVKEIHSLLKKNGVLLIFIPNRNSFGFKTMGNNQNLIIPPIHLHYFNMQSLKKLTDKNFNIIYSKTFGADIADMYAYERDHGSKKFANYLKNNHSTLQTLIDNSFMGNHLRVILKKK